MKTRCMALAMMWGCALAAHSQSTESASPATALADTTAASAKKNVWQKVVSYFADANKDNNKKFDFSLIGGPHYSSDLGVGLGLVGAGLYRIDRSDRTLQPSNVSVFGDVSSKGFYLIGVRGNNFFPDDKYRLNYTTFLFSFPSAFWGIGYPDGDNDANASRLKYFQSRASVEFLIRVAPKFYAGPTVSIDYAKATDVSAKADSLLRLKEQPREALNFGLGGMLVYDTRDCVTNPHRGVYVNASQMFRPRFLGNGDHSFSTTKVTFSAYHSPWKNAILAYQVVGQFNFGNPSWSMMSRMGGSNAMRGYYEGRYRDKNMITAQVELRQRIWKRIGATAWVGAGNVFSNNHRFDIAHTLPNYGVGFRWEFKKNVNVRLDYGFGKSGQNAFMFNINEAF